MALLRRHGIRHARVSAGADARLLGDRRGRPWTLAVPDGQAAALARLPLQDVAVSTAGGHAGMGHPPGLDAHGGRPAAPIAGATVVAADALSAHALAQAVLVLGVERGLRLVEQQQGVEAVVVDRDDCLHGSRGFESLLGEAQATDWRASA